MHIIFKELNESEWCMSPQYYKRIIDSLSAAIKKRNINKKEHEWNYVITGHSESTVFFSVYSL